MCKHDLAISFHLIWPVLTPVWVLMAEASTCWANGCRTRQTQESPHKNNTKSNGGDKGFGGRNGRDVWTFGIKRAG